MKLSKTCLVGFFSLIYFCNPLLAQSNKPEENKYNENVIIVGSYEPTLSDAFKININPTIFDTVMRIPKLKFKINPRIYSVFFTPDQIPPAKVVGEPINRLYRNYVRLGLGTYLSPLAEFYFNSSRSKNNTYGVYFQHNSSLWSIPDYGKNTFGNTTVDVFGKHFWTQSMLGAEAFYTNNLYYYYGFKENEAGALLGTDDLRSSQYAQSYNNVGLKLNYQSLYTSNDKLHHQANFSISNLSDGYGANEMNLNMNVGFEKAFSFFKNDMQTIGISASYDIDKFRATMDEFPITDSVNNALLLAMGGISDAPHSILNFHPFFEFGMKNFLLNLGLNFSFDFDNETKLYVYPDFRISQAFWRNQMNFYAGISGGLKENSLQSLRLSNPYISNFAERAHTDNVANFYGGLVLTPAKQLDLRVEAMYSRLNDYALFGVDTLFVLQNVYKTIYDNVDLFTLSGELKYQYNKALLLTLGGNYYAANTHREDEFWYHPDFDAKFGIQYTIADKIVASFDATASGKTKAYYYLNGERIIEELGARFDLNLSVQYNYSKSLSIFALLNNLANQRYFAWYNYPSQRFKAMAGITYSF